MTSGSLIEILKMMPQDTVILVPVVGGYMPVCPASCGFISLSKIDGQQIEAFIISNCKCNKVEAYAEGVKAIKNINLN